MGSNCNGCAGKVLVVEDDPDIRDTFADILMLEGYPVFTAENGLEAMTVLRESDAPCLILLDLMMPIMNGWEFLDAVKTQERRLSHVPIIVVSAAGERAKEIHTTGFLKKPVDIDALLKAVAHYCPRPKYPTPDA